MSETANDPEPKLRFGVMCDGDHLVDIFARAITKVLAIPGVELDLVIVNESSPARITLLSKGKKFVWRLYQKFFPFSEIPTYRPIDMRHIFSRATRLGCKVIRKGKFSEYFTSGDIETIRSHNLDFILRFGFGIIRGDILQVARYGVWSYHHGDELKFRGGPPGFWEVYFGDPVTAAILQRLTDKLDGGIVLQKCFVKTDQYSHAANLNHLLGATSYMPARVCKDILGGHADYLSAPPSSTDAPIRTAPNSFQLAAFLVKTGYRFLRDKIKGSVLAEEWNVGFTHLPASSFLGDSTPSEVKWLPSEADSFIADPFIMRAAAGSYRLFARKFDEYWSRGVIVGAEIDVTGKPLTPLRQAMDSSWHMSYPHVFQHEGEFYCTPENSRSNTISLYHFVPETDHWNEERVLIKDFAGVDPTIVYHDERWWLFCTSVIDGANSALFIWHAPDLLGPWVQHDKNPVKVDVRSSRPAGPFFYHHGQLYRPAQDRSGTHGGSVRICRILTLTPTQFLEKEVAHINPVPPYPDGIHTLAQAGPITAIDGKRLVFAPMLLWRRVNGTIN